MIQEKCLTFAVEYNIYKPYEKEGTRQPSWNIQTNGSDVGYYTETPQLCVESYWFQQQCEAKLVFTFYFYLCLDYIQHLICLSQSFLVNISEDVTSRKYRSQCP